MCIRDSYKPIPYDRALLTPQQLLLEQELDDEWSDLPPAPSAGTAVLTLAYPHRWAGTLPLNAKTRPFFALGRSPRQRIILVDDQTNAQIVGWVVAEDRYIYGLGDWYKENSIPVGGFIHLSPGPEPGVLMLGYDRRRRQREWVRLAVVKDNRLQFELTRRDIPVSYTHLDVYKRQVPAWAG